MDSILTKNMKSVVSVLILLCVPFFCAYIMSGMFLKYPIISLVWTVFCAVLVIYAVRCCNALLFPGVLLTVLVFAAFCRCVPVYVYEFRYAERTVAELSGSAHRFSGYVCRENANAGEGMYVELVSADGEVLDNRITAYGINRAGHFLPEGAYVEFEAELRKPEAFSEDFDFAGWLYGKGVHCELYRMYEIFPESGLDRISVGSELREWIYQNTLEMLRKIPGKNRFERSGALARALMFGDKSGFSASELDSFNRCGMSHLLCVSGLHFSLILGVVSTVASLVISKKKNRFAVIIAVSVLYLCMCGFSKSALRAAVMALITFSGIYASSRDSGTEKLLVAATVICLADPYAVYDVSFRLSVLSCGGIACASQFSHFLHHKASKIPMLSVFTDIAAMSVGAFTFTFPYTVFAFGGGSAVSVITSVLAIIPAEICLIMLWLAVPAALLGIEAVLFVFASVYSRLCEFIFLVADFFAGLEYSYIPAEVPDYSFAVFLILLAVTGAGAYSVRRERKIFFLAFIFSLISVIMLLIHNSVYNVL